MSGQYKADEFWRSRDFKSSARLYFQHWLFQSTIGHVLDPSVAGSLQSENNDSIKIADLACGNGAWLIEASKALPTATLHGFDIKATQFPAPAFLPANITLEARDVLTSIPADLNGTFDIVHIRAFASMIKNNDTTPILKAAHNLLKPGGFVQWEEAPQDTLIAQSPSDDIHHANMQALLHILAEGGKATGVPTEWYAQLTQQAQKTGFINVQVKEYPTKPEHYKAWTENYLLVWEDVAMLLPLKSDAPDAPLNREGYLQIFAGTFEESNRGVVANTQRLIALVARKPL